jgi:hypothetical protein
LEIAYIKLKITPFVKEYKCTQPLTKYRNAMRVAKRYVLENYQKISTAQSVEEE